MTVVRNSSTLGTLYCIFSAVAYTAYNICLREVSDKQDSAWINCVQASVGAAVFGAYLLWRAAGGRPALPPWKELLALIALGLVTQLGGVLLVWSMGVVGVAITGTLQMGVMLAASAVLGRIVLGERVSWRQVAAIALITVSVVFFSRGAQSAGEAASDHIASNGPSVVGANGAAAPQRILLGIAAAALAGLAFAALTVGIRKTVGGATSPEAIVFLISAMGVVALGPWCVCRLGLPTLLHSPLNHLGVMLAAGAMNLAGFLLVTKSLQMIAVVRVNVLNNGLVMALTVVAGIALFAESWNRDIMLGMLFSIVGTMLISLAGAAEGNSGELGNQAIDAKAGNLS